MRGYHISLTKFAEKEDTEKKRYRERREAESELQKYIEQKVRDEECE